jgi:hypothetical protein
MTQLFNLQSCPNAYQYARLNRQPDLTTPETYRLWYQHWVQKSAEFSYLTFPLLPSDRTSQLQIGEQKFIYPGIRLGEQVEQVYLVPDSLTSFYLSQELPGQKYLYSSAYHYWNQIDFFRDNPQKSLVVVDLDRFLASGDVLVPLSFEPHPSYNTQIPIITKAERSLSVEFDTAELYHAVHSSVAATILQQCFSISDADAIKHLSHYLQRVAFFERIEADSSQPDISFVIEILYQGNVLYREATIQRSCIETVLIHHLSKVLPLLQKIRQQHFVAVASQYNHFPAVRQSFLDAGLMPFGTESQGFPKIWQQKQDYNRRGEFFPLFGFYLDKLEFMIRLSGRDEWLEISAEGKHSISYEGEQKVLTGRIPSSGKDYFTIKQGQTFARLPIRVNGQSYEKNGMVQEFRVDLAEHDATTDTEIALEFCLHPDRPPELRVRDLSTQKRLPSQLQDKPKGESNRFGYLPPDRILSDRQRKSEQRIQHLESLPKFRDILKSLSTLSKFVQQNSGRICTVDKSSKLSDFLGAASLADSATGLLHHVNPRSASFVAKELLEVFQSDGFTDLVQEFSNHFNECKQIEARQKAKDKKPIIGKNLLITLPKTAKILLIFIGRTYQFSGSFSVNSLWAGLEEKVAWAKREGFSSEYFYCLSRTATRPDLQSQYFRHFDQYYQNKEYLWGYGRILMWYFDFSSVTQQQTSLHLEYKEHFRKIIQYLDEQSISADWQPKQNGFLALIYLLTFRKVDPNFCQPHTVEGQMAERLVSCYEGINVVFRQMDTDKSLNQMFQELLEESASEADVNAIIHGS